MKRNYGMLKMLFQASLFLLFVLSVLAEKPGVIQIRPEGGGDYCFLFPSQWTKAHQEDNPSRWLYFEPLTPHLTYAAICCLPSFLGEKDNDGGGFITRIASVREGNCNLFENAKLHQINGTQGLLTLGGDAPYPTNSWEPRYTWGHCEEISIPGILLSKVDVLYLLFKNLIRDLLYKTGIIYLMSLCTVIIGSYWAGSTEKKKQQYIESECETEDLGEIMIDTNVCFTLTCTVMATFTLLALYCFYDYLALAMLGIFCLYASFSLYSCLGPIVSKLPFGKCVIDFPYFHKRLDITTLTLAVLCMSINAIWVIVRNNKEWGWILQDILGMSIGIYVLKTVHICSLKNCSLFLVTHLFYDLTCLSLTHFLTNTGKGITDITAYRSPNSEEIPFLLKVPILSSTSILDKNSFTVVGLGDIVLPGFLVAYCYRFDVQIDSTGVYFLASILAYSYGLFVTFATATFLQTSQSTLLYLVPCILITTLAVAASRKELNIFWAGMALIDDSSQYSCHKTLRQPNISKVSKGQLGQHEEILNNTSDKEVLINSSSVIYSEDLPDSKTQTEEITNCISTHKELLGVHEKCRKEEA